jgi:hypothetical protein
MGLVIQSAKRPELADVIEQLDPDLQALGTQNTHLLRR